MEKTERKRTEGNYFDDDGGEGGGGGGECVCVRVCVAAVCFRADSKLFNLKPHLSHTSFRGS